MNEPVQDHFVLQSSQMTLVMCQGSGEFVVIGLDSFAIEATLALHSLPLVTSKETPIFHTTHRHFFVSCDNSFLAISPPFHRG